MSAKMVLEDSAVDLVRRILPMASKDTKRSPLTGIRFDVDAAVACDSYRLAIAHFDGRALPSVTVPADSVRRSLPKAGEWAPNGDLDSIDKDYPNWRGLLGKCRWSWALTYDRATLLRQLAAPVIERGQESVVILDGSPALSYRRGQGHRPIPYPESGVAAESGAVGIEGAVGARVWVNARFLRDMLRSSRLDRVCFEIESDTRPVMLREPGLTQLLMPIRMPPSR